MNRSRNRLAIVMPNCYETGIAVPKLCWILHARWLSGLQVLPGGSLSNTLMALSRLGQADNVARGSGGIQVAMAAIAGCDPLGRFYAAQTHSAGVHILTEPPAGSNTGELAPVTSIPGGRAEVPC